MISPREKQLVEGLRNKLIAIQGSREIFEELSNWERNVLRLGRNEIKRVARSIAAKVERWAKRIESKTGDLPLPEKVMDKIQEELERI